MNELRNQKRIGILLMSFGGPESLEEIPDFLLSLLGRQPPERLKQAVTERYRMLGGRSPLPEVTRQQARALQEWLAGKGFDWPVRVGMQHASPTIEAGIQQLREENISHLLAMSLAPYRSQASTSAYEKKVLSVVQQHCPDWEIAFPQDWHHHPLFIGALAEKLEECRQQLPADTRNQVPIIFSAHSLPRHFIEQGDPYVEQLEMTIRGIDDRIGPLNWRLGFQSKGGASDVPWLEPEVEQLMDAYKAQGHDTVIVDPIGFVTDHLETLYDNDILHKEYAEQIGMKFLRCPCLNVSPAFIESLGVIALETARRSGFLEK